MNETDNLLEPKNHVSFLESTKKTHYDKKTNEIELKNRLLGSHSVLIGDF